MTAENRKLSKIIKNEVKLDSCMQINEVRTYRHTILKNKPIWLKDLSIR